MKILSFGVVNWDTDEECQKISGDLIEWRDRLRSFINGTKINLVAGSYSDDKFNPLNDVDLIQTNIAKTKPYSKPWNYFQSGFITGIFYSMLSNIKWDLLVHCQCRTFLGQDMIPYMKEFLNRPDQIMAPKFTSCGGLLVEVSFICMKPDAVRKIAYQFDRPSLSNNPDEKMTEEHLTEMFSGSWYDPFPEVITTRQIEPTGLPTEGNFSLPLQQFMHLPLICGSVHCPPEYKQLWLKDHPLK